MKKSTLFVEILTTGPNQTKKAGEILAKEILKSKLKKTAFIIGLEGDLGGGKTTFLQGFAKGLGIKQRILSPSFIIMRKSEIPASHRPAGKSAFKFFYHIDCYRIKKPKELLNLGFQKIILNPKNIAAIEWSDRIRKILPRGSKIMKFEIIDKNKRRIYLKCPKKAA